jgi:choline dehydrogenase-like flavoprotein
MFMTAENAPLRGVPTPDKPGGFYDATVDGGWNVEGEPYSVSEGSDPFQWWRPRMLGGRSNHWGRVALRFGPYDFKPNSRDGLGVDWPISYDDLAPWYDKIERTIGVTGLPHGIENTPDSPEGIHLPPPPPRVHELFLERAFEQLGMRVAAIRAAVLTKQLNGRPACLYATPCTRGCSIGANFQSTTVLIPTAQKTGNLVTRCDSVVRKIDLNTQGRATGVTFNDRQSGQLFNVRARTVVLAAGAFSSVRILLNSKSTAFPNGAANSSGLLGKYIMDSVEFTLSSHIPALEKIPPQNDDGISTPHIYVPWWLYGAQAKGELDFPRGYHIEPRGGRRPPTLSVGGYADSSNTVYGVGLAQEIRRKYGSYVFLTGEGEMIPNDQTFCTLSQNKTDKWGVPVLEFHWKWGMYEKRQVAHMQKTFNEIFRLLGGTTSQVDPVMPTGGGAIHEVGGARCGSSPINSVVNEYGQAWDIENLFVLDGSIFSSSADKNPTLTIMALAARGADYMCRLKSRGRI